jgi:hypothetical protein
LRLSVAGNSCAQVCPGFQRGDVRGNDGLELYNGGNLYWAIVPSNFTQTKIQFYDASTGNQLANISAHQTSIGCQGALGNPCTVIGSGPRIDGVNVQPAAAYTTVATDNIVHRINPAARTITLISASLVQDGTQQIIKDAAGPGAGAVTVTPMGTQKIDGVNGPKTVPAGGALRFYELAGQWFTF